MDDPDVGGERRSQSRTDLDLPQVELASEDDLRRAYVRLRLLIELGHHLMREGAEDSTALIDEVLQAGVRLVGAERGFLAVGTVDRIRPLAVHGMEISEGKLPVSRTILASAMKHGESILTYDAPEDPRFEGADSIETHGIRSVLCCPFGPRPEPRGVLYVDHLANRRAFDRLDLEFLSALARHADLVLATSDRLRYERELGAERCATLQDHYAPDPEMTVRSERMQETLARVRKIAARDASVVLVGESGAGKEVLARVIHDSSPRRDEPFVPINLRAVADELVASALFGHKKGAFTGADKRRLGVFREAAGGTLFLDEVTTIPADVQVMLLRALEQRTIRPLGADGEVPIDVRLVAACNVDIEAEVEAGRFRADLYHRLAVVTVDVPPLRERREDVPALVEHFLRRLDSPKRFDDDALERLQRYSWRRNNVRELRNVVEQMDILTDGDVIGVDDLPAFVLAGGDEEAAAASPGDGAAGPAAGLATMAEAEKAAIEVALAHFDGNRRQAAEHLGIGLRTLYDKLKRYGIG